MSIEPSGGVPAAHVGDEKRQLGPCVNPDCDADGECTCPGDRGFAGPVEPVADTEAAETVRRVPEESYTITTECRANRGDGGAWDEAAARLRVVYNAQLARFGPAAVYRLEFHREPAPGVPRYVYDAARDSRPVALPTAREDREPDECERPDCRQIAATASDVYCEITGGLLSYPTYDARTILAEAGEYTQRLIDEETVRLREEIAAALEAEKSSNEFRNVVLDRAAAIARGASS